MLMAGKLQVRQTRVAVAALAVFALVATQANAQSPSEQRGLNFVRANCARCHAIDKVSESPLKIAPPFRTLHLRYPIESLQEAFAEGIRTGHDNMPEFRLEADQIGDVIAYFKTLER
jgi:mono/diheme cytochrome c family protein